MNKISAIDKVKNMSKEEIKRLAKRYDEGRPKEINTWKPGHCVQMSMRGLDEYGSKYDGKLVILKSMISKKWTYKIKIDESGETFEVHQSALQSINGFGMPRKLINAWL